LGTLFPLYCSPWLEHYSILWPHPDRSSRSRVVTAEKLFFQIFFQIFKKSYLAAKKFKKSKIIFFANFISQSTQKVQKTRSKTGQWGLKTNFSISVYMKWLIAKRNHLIAKRILFNCQKKPLPYEIYKSCCVVSYLKCHVMMSDEPFSYFLVWAKFRIRPHGAKADRETY
jgi:hypothetical protein